MDADVGTCEGVPVDVIEPVRVGVDVPSEEGVADMEGVGNDVGDAAPDGVLEMIGELRCVGLRENVCVVEALAEGELLVLAEIDGLVVLEALWLREEDCVPDRVPVPVFEGLRVSVLLRVEVTLGLRVRVIVGDGVAVTLLVCAWVPVRDCVSDGDAEPEDVSDTEGVAVDDHVPETLGVLEDDAVSVAEGEAIPEVVPVSLADLVELGVPVEVGVRVMDEDSLPEEVAVALGVVDWLLVAVPLLVDDCDDVAVIVAVCDWLWLRELESEDVWL